MKVPNTSIRTSHAIAIRANGVTIGKIQSWAPNQSRTITAAYELNPDTSGDPVENVPGNVTGLTVQVARYDLFTLKMEEAWGTPKALWMLSNQLNPLEITEKWVRPNGVVETYLYEGCWFSQIGRNMQAQGDRIVLVNATLAYLKMSPQ